MYIAVPLVFLAIIFWAFILLLSGGKLIFSGDKKPPTLPLRSPRPSTMVKVAVKKAIKEAAKTETKKTPFISMPIKRGTDFQYIEIDDTDVKAYQKQGYTIVWK